MDFHIEINGESAGPFTQSEIESKLEEGSIGSDTLVWHYGLYEWQPLGQVFKVEHLNGPPSGSPKLPPLSKASQATTRNQRTTKGVQIEERAAWIRRPAFIISVAVVITSVILTSILISGKKKDANDDVALQQIEELKKETQRLSEQLEKAQQKSDLLATSEKPAKSGNDTNESGAKPSSAGESPSTMKLEIATTADSVRGTRLGEKSGPIVEDSPRLNLIGPKILGIQLGDNVDSVCKKFNAEFGSDMNGQRMEVRQFKEDGTFVCSTSDGLTGAAQRKQFYPNTNGEPPLSPAFRWGGCGRDEKANPYQ